MRKRYCTFPKDPFGFRDWYEEKFGDLCKVHDEKYYIGYKQGGCKLCADIEFALGIARRGYWILSALSFLAVQMPWLWWRWARNAIRKEED